MPEPRYILILRAFETALGGTPLGPHPKPPGLQVDRRANHQLHPDQLVDKPRIVVVRGEEAVERIAPGCVHREMKVWCLLQVAGSNRPDAEPLDDTLAPLFAWTVQQVIGSMDGPGTDTPGWFFGGLAIDCEELGSDTEYEQDRIPLGGVSHGFRVRFETAPADAAAQPD